MPGINEPSFLEVRNVCKSYSENNGFSLKKVMRPILKDVSFSIPRGITMGLLGESGSGKSTLSRQILGLEKPDNGEILINGQEVSAWRKANPGKISVVFQDYSTSINPTLTVAEAIAEGFNINRKKKAARSEILDLMERVGLPKELAGNLPGQLSGGQAQRVCIARAVASNPDFIVFDEAVSALDVLVQAQIIDLLKQLKGSATYLFITHDIQIAALLCDEILVLHQGKVTDTIASGALSKSESPYLRKLLESTVIFKSTFKNADS